jgi:thiol-disulfide isomerase/thioredoxin
MKLWISLALILGVLYWQKRGVRAPTPTHTPALTEVRQRFPSCAGKQHCLVVYLAPWCGACKSILPELQTLTHRQSESPHTGVQVIVGEGRQSEDNERMASYFGPAALVDADRSLHASLGVRYYPTMIVLGASDQILHRDEKAFTWTQKALQP